MLTRTSLAALLLGVLTLAGCGGDSDESSTTPPAGSDAERKRAPTLTVYSGREEEYLGGLYEKFTAATGIPVEVKYGDSAELAAVIAEEGDNSPADVFFSQDAGALGALAKQGLLAPMDATITGLVDDRFAAESWVGTSGRGRVLAYSTDRVELDTLPPSVLDLTAPGWKGRVGIAPTNGSFQAFVTALRLATSDEVALTWLEDMAANDVQSYEKNSQIVEAIAEGEIDAGLVNSYYVHEVSRELGESIPVANHFFEAGDAGALVNVAGIGIVASSDAPDPAAEFAQFMLGTEAQTHFAQVVGEYPLAAGVEPLPDLKPLAQVQGPDVPLAELGEGLERTLELIAEAGYTS